MPASFYSLNERDLWLFKPETKQIKIVSFNWNEENSQTEDVQVRLLKLPNEITVERDGYLDETLRRKLAESLVESLWRENYVDPSNVDTLMNSYLSEVLNLYDK